MEASHRVLYQEKKLHPPISAENISKYSWNFDQLVKWLTIRDRVARLQGKPVSESVDKISLSAQEIFVCYRAASLLPPGPRKLFLQYQARGRSRHASWMSPNAKNRGFGVTRSYFGYSYSDNPESRSERPCFLRFRKCNDGVPRSFEFPLWDFMCEPRRTRTILLSS